MQTTSCTFQCIVPYFRIWTNNVGITIRNHPQFLPFYHPHRIGSRMSTQNIGGFWHQTIECLGVWSAPLGLYKNRYPTNSRFIIILIKTSTFKPIPHWSHWICQPPSPPSTFVARLAAAFRHLLASMATGAATLDAVAAAGLLRA